ncbi:hypothetical protein NPIL_471291, partial [Nephila pilipes]
SPEDIDLKDSHEIVEEIEDQLERMSSILNIGVRYANEMAHHSLLYKDSVEAVERSPNMNIRSGDIIERKYPSPPPL